MKKNLFALSLIIAGLSSFAQTPRLSLYEEFTGETCPPCASTNPGLNLLLASPTSTPKIVAIKWQVPIPSAPSNTWSLYRTNKAEIDWRYKSTAAGGYGYGISSAPSSKIDGQDATVFGASSSHPANLNSGVISTAQSYTSAFSVTMDRSWDANLSAINLTVSIKATANFNAVGALMFRTVMVERLINFSVQPGTNGEKDFEDAAIQSFPTTTSGTVVTGMGTLMQSNWTVGQTQTFTLNCPVPAYTRKKEQIAFVGFIQDDGNKKVAQAVRADKQGITPNDAQAMKVNTQGLICNNSIAPTIVIKNNGSNAITALTITPYVDGSIKNTTTWSGNLNNGASVTITLNPVSSTVGGGHTFSCNISGVSGGDNNTLNNSISTTFYAGGGYNGTPVSEGFVSAAYPPTGWGLINSDGSTTWSKINTVGGFNLSTECSKYDFYNNPVIGDEDELYLPAMNLSGANDPILTFDLAYAQRTINSNDKLEVRVSDNCGANWTTVYSQAGSALSTAPITSGAYTPPTNNDSHWRTESVTLVGFNKAAVLVKFVAINDNGNNAYIDNVNLSQSSPTGISKISGGSFKATLFPNPSNGVTTLNISAVNSSNAKISVVNTLGQVVFAKQVSVESGNNNFQIDVKDFAGGLYNVIIDSGNGAMVKKLTVTK